MSQSRDELTPGEEPLFNIGAVSRMTGISETTLRVWERRYDFPTSARTAGGHRLYSQQEVQRLLWVKQRIDEGMQVSQAIRALGHVERDSTPARGRLPAALPPSADHSGEITSPYRRRLLEALIERNSELANEVLAEALAVLTLEYLILDVVGPTLYDIGEAWSQKRLDVATEHFASNYLRQRLHLWLQAGPPPYHVRPVLLACAPGELHEGSLLMLAVLLRRLRWPVIYLGQTVPLSDLAAFINETDPAVIVFVAMTPNTARELAEWQRWLPGVAQAAHPIVAYGGRAFSEQPDLAGQVPGILLGQTIHEGVERLDKILRELNPFLR